ncbi:EpsG family protein [Loktanella agnita]|uniref:EpsG family protein n=1 Tax=Loktanella agnita TaxID=287097 RepID=UPI00398996FF
MSPPQYTYFAILIFFPFVMGMQNIYRQWAACIFFLYCFSIVWNEKTPFKAYIFFILSFLSHNVAAVFLPLLFLRKRTVIGKLAWILSFGVSGAGIYYGAETKSSAATGSNLALAYSFLLFLFVCLIAILDKGIVREDRKKTYWLLISLLTLSIISVFLLSSVGAERISMFGLVISYPILANLLDERFKQKAIIRAIFTVLGFIPMFMFSVSKFIVS